MEAMGLSIIGSILYYVFSFGIAAKMSQTNTRSLFAKLCLIGILPLLLATFRYNVGYDYDSYITALNNAHNQSVASIIKNSTLGSPIAYYLITKFSTIFGSERVFLMILALLSMITGLSYIVDEWNDHETQPLMVFVFFFTTFVFGFSACKQGIAISILISSMKYVYKRKPVRFLICVFCAVLFHSTALAFLPVYFFVNKNQEIGLIKKVLIIAISLLVIFNLRFVLGNVFSGRFEGYATELVEGRNRSFWLYCMLSILFLIYRNYLIEIDKRNELLIMLMVLGTLCNILGFSNAFAKRLGEYFTFSQIFLLPQMCYVVLDNGRGLMKALIVIYIVCIFLIANPVASSGMGFVPYYFKFT